MSIVYCPESDDIKAAPLVLQCFCKKFAAQLFQMDKKEATDLHNHITKNHLYHGGFDNAHSCGSSGTTRVDKCFLKFVHHSGNFLWKGHGIKFVKSSLEWHCHYISPQNGDVAHIRYSTPMVGGPIWLTHKLMNSHLFFEHTVAIKLLALEIINILNLCLDNATQVPITPMACDHEREIRNTENNKLKADTEMKAANLLDFNQNWMTKNLRTVMDSCVV